MGNPILDSMQTLLAGQSLASPSYGTAKKLLKPGLLTNSLNSLGSMEATPGLNTAVPVSSLTGASPVQGLTGAMSTPGLTSAVATPGLRTAPMLGALNQAQATPGLAAAGGYQWSDGAPSLTQSSAGFFSDGSGSNGTLASSGGLDRGGIMAQARDRMNQKDYVDRIQTMAARNLYRNVAGGGDGGGGSGGGSKRIWAGASSAAPTYDQKLAAAKDEVLADKGRDASENDRAKKIQEIRDLELERRKQRVKKDLAK